jgi:glycosyltransferase involved in cell wall biosynthesis
MLSVLIPIYDWDVTALVTTLHQQLTEAAIPFEIRISDNCDTSEHAKKNFTLNERTHVHYAINTQHIGRSANRNYLANQSQFDWLLFLDGDTAVTSPNFISNYISCIPKHQVVCGGTIYEAAPPKDDTERLRWEYGSAKESTAAVQRIKAPYKNYSSFNFLINKAIFNQIRFDNNLTQYGHEDTLFGQELKARGIPIHHIENPLLHLGLDTAIIFIEKTKIAVANLKYLIENKLISTDVKVYRFYLFAKKLHLTTLLSKNYKKQELWLVKQLCSPKPCLHLFMLYKLLYLSYIMQKEH